MKSLIKNCVDLIFILINAPLLILYFVICLVFGKNNGVFSAFAQFYSMLPGQLGNYARANFYRFVMQNCHPRVVVSFATLFSQQKTSIGSGVYIGPQCNIGACIIEKDCLLGSGVHVLSGKGQHNFDDLDTPIREQGGTFSQVTIGEDSWIGNGSIITANIGKKCIIGAGSVVTKDIPDYSVAVGNPAKVIRQRQ
ncbi:acyltransferase [Catenovulum sp. SX2]|uniref:acyltransferase n=1 Tax=Catenovulum sp. SX2 TaxID=3398614 RepID=UPI003F852114